MTSTNAISVIVTTYNRAPKLRRMINSALNQSDVPEEIVVVNDGSTSDYSEIKKWALSHPNVVWVDIANGGVSAARNCGVIQSSSPFVAFCDDDDYFMPNHISTIRRKIEAERGQKGIYHTHRIELRGDLFYEPPFMAKEKDKSWQEHYVTNGEMIPSCTCMHRDIALEFPFPVGIKYAEDHEQRLLALSQYPCYPIYEKTVVMDRTDESATNRNVTEIAEIYRERFHSMFGQADIKNHIRPRYRNQVLYHWTSLELSEAIRLAPREFPRLWLRAGLRVRTWANFKTWTMNLIWFFKERIGRNPSMLDDDL